MSPRIGLDADTIITTAMNIADSKGWSQVTLASIAKQLNIRTPSLYNHVAGQKDIRNRVTLRGLSDLSSAIREAVEGTQGDEAVRAFAAAYVTYARSHPGVYEAAQVIPADASPALKDAAEEIVKLAVQLLGYLQLPQAAVIHHVRGLRSMLHGFALLESGGGFAMPYDREASLHLMIDTFLAGLHKLYAT